MQARRRRAQMPVPKLVDGSWKVWFRIDEERPDGTIARVQRTKILGREGDMTKAEAKRAAAELVRSINNVEEGIEHRRKTVTGLMEAWDLRIKETLKFSTQLSYAWAFQRIQRAFGHVAVQDIGKADVQAFLTAASRELSPESVRDLRARLSGLFTVAETWGWIQPGSNPAKGRLSLPEKRPKRKKILLTPASFHTLVMALKPPYSTLLVLAVLGGLRRGELSALRWNDNPRPGVLVVDEGVYRGRLGSPKTRKSEREVAIGEISQRAINEWQKIAKFTELDHFMFGQRKNTPADLHNAIARRIKPVAVKLGIGSIGWHDLRHTFTTWGRLAGMKAETLRDQLGHSSVLTTLDIYSHAQERVAEAKRMEEYAAAIPVRQSLETVN